MELLVAIGFRGAIDLVLQCLHRCPKLRKRVIDLRRGRVRISIAPLQVLLLCIRSDGARQRPAPHCVLQDQGGQVVADEAVFLHGATVDRRAVELIGLGGLVPLAYQARQGAARVAEEKSVVIARSHHPALRCESHVPGETAELARLARMLSRMP